MKNYGPISLLSVFSKVLKNYLAENLNQHWEINNILSERQFGFRRKRGTQDAVNFLHNFATTEIDRGRIPATVMLDYTAASQEFYLSTSSFY